MDFPDWWVSLIMECLSISSFTFCLNGDISGHVIPSHGLREGDCRTLKEILGIYEWASGQSINLEQSETTLSPNISDVLRRDLLSILGVRNIISSHETFLGLPTIVGRNKYKMFAAIKSKKIAWVNGRKVGFPKGLGGLGFHDLQFFNKDLVANEGYSGLFIPVE
ncbi:hypothetical protein PanWU01x14_018500 [Parasponia andersonii]|uniref:Uncharacterized protein n=1 Tax=Parasponia andersonii TaxID=3476 RepID=A0A2P5DZ71_PARAD|nr:hypothetical protein PanWU01x14_018500 [Parasponia andersonii]